MRPSFLFAEPEEDLERVVALIFAEADVPPRANRDECDGKEDQDPLVMVGWDDQEKVFVIDSTLGVLALIMPKIPKFHAATKAEVDNLAKTILKIASLVSQGKTKT